MLHKIWDSYNSVFLHFITLINFSRNSFDFFLEMRAVIPLVNVASLNLQLLIYKKLMRKERWHLKKISAGNNVSKSTRRFLTLIISLFFNMISEPLALELINMMLLIGMRRNPYDEHISNKGFSWSLMSRTYYFIISSRAIILLLVPFQKLS